jgi:BMFP domain-containing protein YqiC
MAGGAFSVMTAVRNEAEAMAKAQAEAMVQRLELVRREELDAALEVARRAREQAETLAHRLAELEARVAALEAPREDAASADDVP